MDALLMPPRRSVIVMGVSGCGKTTVGQALAHALGMPFLDADGLHSDTSVRKMAVGIPLADGDRWPWLDAVGRAATAPTVIACSALRVAYRDRLRDTAGDLWFLELTGSRELLRERLRSRAGHFMPASLLDSQLQTLEDLEPAEAGLIVDIASDIGAIVEEAVGAIAVGRPA